MDQSKMGVGLGIRGEFPMFSKGGDLGTLHYLDSAASSLKPRSVIERLSYYLSFQHANIHRGAYALSAGATELYHGARGTVAKFLNAASERSVVFTKGSTQAINLVAHALEGEFKAGDTILLTKLEHHSNIVPWQLLAKRRDIGVQFAEIRSDASLDVQDFKSKLQSERPKLVCFTSTSNAFGSIFPVQELISLAHSAGSWVLLDASQAVMHRRVDVQTLDADFLVFTGHKIYGPTGIGVLYAKEELLERMQPFEGGGDMIAEVTTEGSTWAEYPRKFEAGTPPIAEAIGLGAALDFVSAIGLERIESHERKVFDYAWSLLSKEPGVKLYGPATNAGEQGPIVPFTIDGVHPHDFATVADSFGVQVRAGHHCAMPAMRALNLTATARASIGVYSMTSDFDALLQAIQHAKRLFT